MSAARKDPNASAANSGTVIMRLNGRLLTVLDRPRHLFEIATESLVSISKASSGRCDGHHNLVDF
jgi:hypothetical protein